MEMIIKCQIISTNIYFRSPDKLSLKHKNKSLINMFTNLVELYYYNIIITVRGQ